MLENLTRARDQTRGQQPSIALEFIEGTHIGAPPREAARCCGDLPAAWLAAEGLYRTGQSRLGVLGGKALQAAGGQLPVPGPACLRAWERGGPASLGGIQEHRLSSGPDLAHSLAAAMFHSSLSCTVCLGGEAS